jgi:hypothetical protein
VEVSHRDGVLHVHENYDGIFLKQTKKNEITKKEENGSVV